MQEDHQKISSCEVLNNDSQCVHYPIIKKNILSRSGMVPIKVL